MFQRVMPLVACLRPGSVVTLAGGRPARPSYGAAGFFFTGYFLTRHDFGALAGALLGGHAGRYEGWPSEGPTGSVLGG